MGASMADGAHLAAAPRSVSAGRRRPAAKSPGAHSSHQLSSSSSAARSICSSVRSVRRSSTIACSASAIVVRPHAPGYSHAPGLLVELLPFELDERRACRRRVGRHRRAPAVQRDLCLPAVGAQLAHHGQRVPLVAHGHRPPRTPSHVQDDDRRRDEQRGDEQGDDHRFVQRGCCVTSLHAAGENESSPSHVQPKVAARARPCASAGGPRTAAVRALADLRAGRSPAARAATSGPL